jgi:hypothetical protein
VDPGAEEADWALAPAVEAEEQVAAAPQAGAAAPAVREACGRPANPARHQVVGRVVAELAQAGLAVEAETAAVAPEVEGRVEEAELEEAGELAAPVQPASQESGWPQQQCSREACWEAFRV